MATGWTLGPSATSAAPLLTPDPTARPYTGQAGGSYIGPAAVTERKKLISSGFLLQSTPHIPCPDYGAISSMHGGLGVAAAENRLKVMDSITHAVCEHVAAP